jgi:hypothetical protein
MAARGVSRIPVACYKKFANRHEWARSAVEIAAEQRAPDSEEGTAGNVMPPRFITGGLTGGHFSHDSDPCCEEGLNNILRADPGNLRRVRPSTVHAQDGSSGSEVINTD